MGLAVPVNFLFRIPDNKVFAMAVTDELRGRVGAGVDAIRGMRESREVPEATAVRGRCVECEYANYCGADQVAIYGHCSSQISRAHLRKVPQGLCLLQKTQRPGACQG